MEELVTMQDNALLTIAPKTPTTAMEDPQELQQTMKMPLPEIKEHTLSLMHPLLNSRQPTITIKPSVHPPTILSTTMVPHQSGLTPTYHKWKSMNLSLTMILY